MSVVVNHEQNHSGVQKDPFMPHPSSSVGVLAETGEGKYPENVLVIYLLGLKALHSPRRGGALLLPWCGLWSCMPAPTS